MNLLTLAFSTPYLIPLIGGSLAGIHLLRTNISQYLLLQKIKNTPTSKADAAAVGLVELSGKIRAQADLLSPLTKTKCSFWKVKIEYYPRRKHNSKWFPLAFDQSPAFFYLEDNSGKILIDPKEAQIEIKTSNLFQGQLATNSTYQRGLEARKQWDDYMAKNPQSSWHLVDSVYRGFSGDPKPFSQPVFDYINSLPDDVRKKVLQYQYSTLRVVEYLILDGDLLYVLGTAEPREGVSSAVASENLIVRKGKFDKIMFIRESSEQKLTNDIGIWTYLGILCGFLLLIICVPLLLFIFLV